MTPSQSQVQPFRRLRSPPITFSPCGQILACSNMIGAAESLVYARRAGLDAEAVVRCALATTPVPSHPFGPPGADDLRISPPPRALTGKLSGH